MSATPLLSPCESYHRVISDLEFCLQQPLSIPQTLAGTFGSAGSSVELTVIAFMQLIILLSLLFFGLVTAVCRGGYRRAYRQIKTTKLPFFILELGHHGIPPEFSVRVHTGSFPCKSIGDNEKNRNISPTRRWNNQSDNTQIRVYPRMSFLPRIPKTFSDLSF